MCIRDRTIFISATPGPFELERSGAAVVEQVVRPTGLVDPETEVRPALHQVDDLLGEIRARVERRERVLVKTLTKRMDEALTSYLAETGVKVRYLHADIDTCLLYTSTGKKLPGWWRIGWRDGRFKPGLALLQNHATERNAVNRAFASLQRRLLPEPSRQPRVFSERRSVALVR